MDVALCMGQSKRYAVSTDGRDGGTMAIYRIRVNGHFDDSWADHFGRTVAKSVHADEPQRSTTWTYTFEDQAALIGVLRHMNGLGLELLLVEHLFWPQ